jgi:hypothetical protein
VWTVLEHPSSSVVYNVYKEMLEKVAELLPFQCTVVFTADRGFADTHLMAHLTRLGWHWRIRIKGSFGIYRAGKRVCTVNRIRVAAGQALFWHHVYMTKQEYGPVHLALGRCSAPHLSSGRQLSPMAEMVVSFKLPGWLVAQS